ncbi:hypothetical protein INT47_011470, partial [Mucor saturninus]
MFGGSSSNKNEGVPKSKPGPKVEPKRDPHEARAGPKRSGREQDQSMSTFFYGNVGSTMHSPVAEDIQNIQMEVNCDEEINNIDLIVVESEQNVVEDSESDEEEMLGDVTNISDDYANTAAEQELTEEEFEIIDEQ